MVLRLGIVIKKRIGNFLGRRFFFDLLVSEYKSVVSRINTNRFIF